MPHFKKREILIECQILTKLIKIKKMGYEKYIIDLCNYYLSN